MRVRAVDIGVAVVMAAFAIAVLAAGFDTNGPVSNLAYIAAAVGGLAIVARRDMAIPVLVVVAAARVFVAWDTGDDLALTPAAILALYTVARHGKRWPRLIIATAIGVTVAAITASFGDEGFFNELVAEAAQNLLPIAVADAVRTQADRVRDLVDAEADARVQAERLRIARDLHDVVAHGLSTIAIQSGVAARLIDRDPAQAKGALEAINATGKSSLEELRGLLGVLRSTDGAELRPTPSEPDDIGEILTQARGVGVEVHHEVTGSFPPDVSDAAVVAVHRIVQEALTNVSRHAGPVAATVSLVHGSDEVGVEIINDPPAGEPQAIPSTGVGIVGMRERAESLGGSLDAGPTDAGGYRVVAQVPYGRHAS